MNPYEPKVTIVHEPGSRSVKVYVTQHSGRGYENLRLVGPTEWGGTEFQWEPWEMAAEADPFLTLPEEVYAALRSTLVGDKLEEREFLRGRIEELERALTIEQARVDRVLP